MTTEAAHASPTQRPTLPGRRSRKEDGGSPASRTPSPPTTSMAITVTVSGLRRRRSGIAPPVFVMRPLPTCKVTLAGGPLFRLGLRLSVLSYCGLHGGDDDGIHARPRGGVGHERHESRVDALVRLEGDPVYDVGLDDDPLQDLGGVLDADMEAGGANHHREVARLRRELCGLPEVRVDLGHVHSYFVCLTRTLMSAPSMKPPNRAAPPT